MKKVIVLLLVLSLTLGSVSFSYASGPFTAIGEGIDNILKSLGKTIQELINLTISKFKDIKVTDWFINTVSKLVGIGGIDGYPDGTFRPNATITRAEFTKVLVSSLGFTNPTKTGTHWASGYISKAEEIKLISKGEFKDLDSAITRNEMAKMSANALDYLNEEHVKNREDYIYQIKDFQKIPKEYQDYVLKAYAKGIISGYPDGTFKGSQGLTRAEASSVIIRVIDETERVLPPTPVEEEDKDEDLTDSTWIEPEIYVFYHEDMWDPWHFSFFIENYLDYENKKEHIFTTECISHPQINTIHPYSTLDGGFLTIITDMIALNKTSSHKFQGLIGIYSLSNISKWKPVNGTFNIKDGDLMQYKVTVTNGVTTKEYIINAYFNERDFSIKDPYL